LGSLRVIIGKNPLQVGHDDLYRGGRGGVVTKTGIFVPKTKREMRRGDYQKSSS